MKKTIGLALVLVLILLLAVSCGGVAQDKYDKATSDLAIKTDELQAANTKLAKVKNEIAVINAFLLPSMTGEINQMTQSETMNLFLEWRDKVNLIGDSSLSAKFQAMIDNLGSEASTIAFFKYLLEDTAKTVD